MEPFINNGKYRATAGVDDGGYTFTSAAAVTPMLEMGVEDVMRQADGPYHDTLAEAG